MKIILSLFLLFNFLFALKDKKNVLILQSYDSSVPWTNGVQDGIKKANEKYNKLFNFYTINFDFIRAKDKISHEEWYYFINKQYKHVKFDGIFIDAQYASEILASFGEDYYPNIPKVYNETKIQLHKKNELNLHFFRDKVIEKTVNLAFKVHKSIKKVYIIKGTFEDSKLLNKVVKEKLKDFKNIDLEIVSNYTFEEIYKNIKNFEKNSIAFAGLIAEDRNKNRIIPNHFLEKLAKSNLDIPIYSFVATNIGTGVMGGYMMDSLLSGEKMIDAIYDYSQNGKFKPKENYSIMQGYLDWEKVKRFNISTNNLPSDIKFINKPPSIFETFFIEAVTAIILIATLFLTLLSTLYLVYKLKVSSIKLKIETEEKLKKEELLIKQTKNAFMGEMISSIAHQWRQPLSRINSNLSVLYILLEKIRSKDEPIFIKLKNIEEQSLYMSRTIDDFSNFLSPKKIKKEFLLDEAINKTIKLLNVKTKQVDIQTKLESNLKLFSYENEFNQALLSILTNCVENFFEKNISDPKITITLKKVEHKYKIYIHDNGGGIAENIKEKIFEAYVSSKKRSTPNGLGLYITKNIIEKSMNGKIIVKNLNGGALFIISLTMEEEQ